MMPHLHLISRVTQLFTRFYSNDILDSLIHLDTRLPVHFFIRNQFDVIIAYRPDTNCFTLLTSCLWIIRLIPSLLITVFPYPSPCSLPGAIGFTMELCQQLTEATDLVASRAASRHSCVTEENYPGQNGNLHIVSQFPTLHHQHEVLWTPGVAIK
jgi:hypothetical protein